MERVTLNASFRTALGKKVRSLRRRGIMPIHVYGLGGDPLALQAPSDQVHAALVAAGHTTPVTIRVEGADGEEVTLVRDVAHHVVTGALQHVDFLRVDPDKPVEVSVPVELRGEAPGVRGGAGFVTQGLHEIHVLAKPFEVPSEIVVDVSALVSLDSEIRVGDLVLPGATRALTDASTLVVWIHASRAAEAAEMAEAPEAAAGEASGGAPAGGERRDVSAAAERQPQPPR
ncbi:MAG: 50S ribosomal protein L25 [Gemmatimonadetes bacterium]|nr:50S ribosomal protein L25 [Gemmatimonadota bacterium]